MTNAPADRERPTSAASFSSLGMYPFERLRPSWERLYECVAAHVPGAPVGLRWDLDPHDTWSRPDLGLGMTCGWPLVTNLVDRVRVVGTFEYSIGGSVGHSYRSVIIARNHTTVSELAGATLAFNSTDSLSGYISMMSLLPESGLPVPLRRWPGSTIETGAHVASIAAVRSNVADIASIDGLTWAFAERDDPSSIEGLVVIERGPVVPHLPLIVPAATSDGVLASWRSALTALISKRAAREALDDLAITGFVPLDASDYDAALDSLR